MDWGKLCTISGGSQGPGQGVLVRKDSNSKRILEGSTRGENGRNTTLSGLLFSVVLPCHAAICTLRSPSSIFRFCASKSRTPSKWKSVYRQNRSACVTRVAVWQKVFRTDAIWDNTWFSLKWETPRLLSHYATPILTLYVSFWSQLFTLQLFLTMIHLWPTRLRAGNVCVHINLTCSPPPCEIFLNSW
jgi:hypothetical protein